MAPTPGVTLLARNALTLLAPSALVGLLRVLSVRYSIPVPNWVLAAVWTFSLPAYVAFRVLKASIIQRVRARRLGARIVPHIRGKWPGNLDVIKEMHHKHLHGYPADGLYNLTQEYGGVFNLWALWENNIFTSDPRHIKRILATDFQNFDKGERWSDVSHSVLGTGIFAKDGDLWKFHRGLARPFFSRDRITHFDLFDHHSALAINAMKDRLRSGYAIDFQDVVARFTLDSATEFLFGRCVNSMSSTLPYPHNVSPAYAMGTETEHARIANEFVVAFAKAQACLAVREISGWLWPLAEIFGESTAAPMKIVNAYIEPIIQAALDKKAAMPVLEKGEADELDDDVLIDTLVRLTSDPVIIKDQILNILVAGRDTTAATLTFVVYFLSKYPAVMSRLREEVLQAVGPSRRPTFDDIKNMKYLRAVINETLRLYPIVPFNVREAVNETTWPSSDPTQKPLYIPAKSKVLYSVFIMQRDPELWGPDAEEFDPDRFLDDRLKKYLVLNSFIFLPFNAGPRICLGQQFAYNEMSFMIIRLLQTFSSITMDRDATPPEGIPPKEWKEERGRKGIDELVPKTHLTMYNRGGLWVKMEEARYESESETAV